MLETRSNVQPAAPVSPATPAAASIEKTKATHPRPRILVVDDDPGVLESLQQLLRLNYREHDILSATVAEEAMQAIETGPVELVITDLRLPTIDGLELAHQIKRRTPDTHFILMTAFGTGEIMVLSHQRGCIAYLEKPFSIEQLLQYVDEALHPENRMSAQLQNLHLEEIIEMYLSKATDVVLGFTCGEQSGLVALQKGSVVHSQFDGDQGIAALKSMLHHTAGEIKSLNAAPPHQQTLHLPLAEFRKLAQETRSAREGGKNALFPEIQRTRQVSAKLKSATSGGVRPLMRETVQQHVDEQLEEENLELHTQPEDALAIKRRQVEELVEQGIAHFHAKRTAEAGRCWNRALRIDPDCVAAKKNIQLLEKNENLDNEGDGLH